MVIWSAVSPWSVPAALVPSAGPQGVGRSPNIELSPPAATVVEEPLPPGSELRLVLPQATASIATTATAARAVIRFVLVRKREVPPGVGDQVAAGAAAGGPMRTGRGASRGHQDLGREP